AKAIGGGLPLGVTLARAELMDWGPGAHASTFGGNPIAIEAALKTFELLENGIIDNAAELGAYLIGRLRELEERYTCIAEVRGLGLMIGIEIAHDRTALDPWPELRNQLVMACFRQGLILQGAGESAIRFSPPLIIDKDQADFAVDTLALAIKQGLS
ncbi:MAG TPA: aminotransferase class III-fold pyridoxal phosphate-dependent enzyme, partial [Blastocatellia bacterium]